MRGRVQAPGRTVGVIGRMAEFSSQIGEDICHMVLLEFYCWYITVVDNGMLGNDHFRGFT